MGKRTNYLSSHGTRLFTRFVEGLVPEDSRDLVLGDMEESGASYRRIARNAAGYVGDRLRHAFNVRLVTAEALALAAAFAGGSPPATLFIVLAAALGVLVLRDAYSHPIDGSMAEAARDAVYTVVVLFVVLASLRLLVTPPAMPADVLIRGLLVSLLAVGGLRMVYRWKPPQGPQERAVRAYWSTSWMNVVYLLACFAVIGTNGFASIPLFPGRDFLFIVIPMAVLSIIVGSQRASLLPERHNLARLRDRLWGADRTRSSHWYAVVEALFLVVLAAPLAIAVLAPGGDVDWLRVWTNLVVVLTLSMLWLYIRKANRVTARLLQEQIDAVAG